MKKLSLIILAVIMLVSARVCSADVVYTRSTDARIKVEVTQSSVYPVLSTTITTANRVIGFTYSDSAAGKATLFDVATAATAAAANAFGEVNVAAGGTTTVMFPYPKEIDNGLVTFQTTTTGTLIIYYE